MADADRDRIRAESELRSADERDAGLHDRLRMLDERIRPFACDLDQHRVLRNHSRVRGEVLSDRAEVLERRLTEEETRISALGDRRSGLAGRIAENRDARTGVESRKHLLEEMANKQKGQEGRYLAASGHLKALVDASA